MKKILLSLFAILLAYGAMAQSVGYGPKAGLNIAMLTDKAFDPRLNFNAGAFVEYDFSAAWSVELAAMYSRQGAKRDDMPVALTEVNDATLRLDYINVPLVLKYYPYMGFNIFLGPQFSFLVNAQQKNEGSTEQSIMSIMHKFDVGATVGVGYTWECGALVSAQYNIGFRTVSERAEVDNLYNSVIQVCVGWRF